MKFIRKIEGAKNSEVSLVEIDGMQWVHKKESADSAINERAFQKLLKELGLPHLEILETTALPDDEIIIEYIPDSPTLDNVEDPELYKKWGYTLSQLHSITSKYPTLLGTNGEMKVDTTTTLWEAMALAEERLLLCEKFSNSEVSEVLSVLKKGFAATALTHSVIHGDMHQANVLIKDGELVLFDKSSRQWAFSPLFDLAIVLINTPNGTLISTDDQEYKKDLTMWSSFVEGYGLIDMAQLKLFCLLEASRRVNNRFEKFNSEIVRNLAL